LSAQFLRTCKSAQRTDLQSHCLPSDLTHSEWREKNKIVVKSDCRSAANARMNQWLRLSSAHVTNIDVTAKRPNSVNDGTPPSDVPALLDCDLRHPRQRSTVLEVTIRRGQRLRLLRWLCGYGCGGHLYAPIVD
jgi:hypothetical protein